MKNEKNKTVGKDVIVNIKWRKDEGRVIHTLTVCAIAELGSPRDVTVVTLACNVPVTGATLMLV